MTILTFLGEALPEALVLVAIIGLVAVLAA